VQASDQARQALQDLPESDYATRGLLMLVLSIALRRCARLDEAARSYEETMAISKAGGRNHVAFLAAIGLAGILEERGLRNQEYEIYQDIIQEVHRDALSGGEVRMPGLGIVHIRLADLLREWYRLEEAMQHARLGLEISRQWGQAEFIVSGRLSLAEILTTKGDFPAAWDEFQKARQERGELPWVARLAEPEMYYWLAKGDLEMAQRWASEYGLAPSDEFGYSRMVTYTGVADLTFALGHYEEALSLLDRMLAIAEPAGANGHVLQKRVLRALTLHGLGRVAEALNDLEVALRLGETEGYMCSFLAYGEPMMELLRKAAARGICTDYANRLLKTAHAQPVTPPQFPASPAATLPEPLSERELEVLRLLESPLSSVDIARELYISTHTVRSHIKSIYAKLDVHNRLEAVQRARQLRLL
jgi:LuxR family maltose regulon positive regulatory protein